MIPWLRRLFSRDVERPRPGLASATVLAPAPPEPPELELLRALPSGDPTRAAAAFRALAGTAHERHALAEAERLAKRGEAPDDLLLAAAETFFRRGDVDEAIALASRATSLGARSLRAEALASRGDLPEACEEIERVLAVDIDAPGARERLDRWRARLGLPPIRAKDASTDATLFSAAPATPFRIVGDAGAGGTATVYRAEDEALARPIALKVYHRVAEARDQLEREATIAINVAGPGVVRIYDADLDEGWLAMEWANEGALRDRLRRKDATLLPLARWALPLVAALARVHAAGWVHGDVKPGNVLFTGAGVLLTDFGIARRPGDAWTGGTRGYLSPERAAGAPASVGDDVYALGKTLADVAAALAPNDEKLAAVVAACTRPAEVRATLDDVKTLLR